MQREQDNINKILNIVDSMIHFRVRTLEFEDAIRDGNLSNNLEEFMEKVNNFKEAIVFFSEQNTYQGQLDRLVGI